MRTLFIGGTKRGYLALKGLLESKADVVGIISLEQDSHEWERYEEPIETLARNFHVPHFQTRRIQEKDFSRLIREKVQPEIAFVIGCRILLPKEIYQIPRKGTLAVHDSLLPKYRGFAPLNWSLLNGEDHTGVTLFYVSEQTDGGDIVAQKRVPIGPDDTAAVVYERVCQATVDILLGTYPLLVENRVSRTPQDHSSASFTCSRTPEDGMIDWSQTTRVIYNQIRA